VVEARIDDELLERAIVATEVQLGALVPAFVDDDENTPVGQPRPVDGLRQGRELLDLSPVRGDPVELPDSRPVGGEQERRAVGREGERPCRRQFEQLLKRPRQRYRRALG
jgi:hypothetical protein